MNNLKLTPLENHLYQIIYGTSPEFLEDNKMYNSITIERINAIKECASVTLKWMEKTFIAGENNGHNRNYLVPADEEGQKADFKKFLKRNGLIPTEPYTKEERMDVPDPNQTVERFYEQLAAEKVVIGSNGIINEEYKE